MISVSGKNWIEKKINKNLIEKIKQDFNFSEIISRLIVSRNFDLSEIYSINNSCSFINDFKKDNDFNKASLILENCIKKKELICIFGDYDVDGISSTSIFINFFQYIKQPYFFYIPDRERDGYGPSKSLFQKLIIKKPKLVLMLDCGSNSNEAIKYLNDNNVKSIIIDHHEINKPFPKSNVIINLKKNTNNNLKDYLCTTALSYFFLEIIIKKIKSSFNLSDHLIYVLMALVCDVMPLRKINRFIALNLINKFKIDDNIIFKTLYDLSKKNNKLSIDDLGYFIGPIINSAGRLSNSDDAVVLLTSKSPMIIKKKSLELIKLNNKRKEIENKLLTEINFEKIQKENKKVIIYYRPNMSEGLIGIIASRLKDYFNKPSIVITNSKNLLKGSARSTTNYNISNVIKKMIDMKLIINGGGHHMAAGFTIKKNNLENFKNYLLKDYNVKNNKFSILNTYDSEISSSAINQSFINEINKLQPYGNENGQPIFLIKELKTIKITKINNKHISLILKPSVGKAIKSISFNSINTPIGNKLISYKKKIHVIGQIKENNWNNKNNIQLNILDIIIKTN
tara:strand:- start:8509 stop:10212 length:1704 start_codon:yes stop_codon:yes gene_type:complete